MKKMKQPGDNISLKTKKNEDPAVMQWINAQTNLMDSIRYLIENEIVTNGVRNLQTCVPAERSLLGGRPVGGPSGAASEWASLSDTPTAAGSEAGAALGQSHAQQPMGAGTGQGHTQSPMGAVAGQSHAQQDAAAIWLQGAGGAGEDPFRSAANVTGAQPQSGEQPYAGGQPQPAPVSEQSPPGGQPQSGDNLGQASVSAADSPSQTGSLPGQADAYIAAAREDENTGSPADEDIDDEDIEAWL